jgi:glycosyltransferase involved in cell wall biosynthesis
LMESDTRIRIAVVSPFLDRRHGTERCVAEQVERLAHDYEVHVYSNRVEEVDLNRIVWHRIPTLPGPHLFAYCWWFVANHLWRWRDRRFRGITPALVYSPGINCLDADLISVHVVFGEFLIQVRESLSLAKSQVRYWPRLIHRKLYYRLIRALEARIYTMPRVTIACVSRRVAKEISVHYHRTRDVHVIHNAVDRQVFNPQRRMARRDSARRELGLSDQDRVLLLIGNHWKSKGLPYVLEALAHLRDLALQLLVVGRDDRAGVASLIHEMQLDLRVKFLQPSSDVIKYYAACDFYVGPSLHDSFALPPLEAMACGLPVITSSRNGGAEIIRSGIDGFIVEDPADIAQLAGLISCLYYDQNLRQHIAENAASTAHQYSWERNAAELRALIEQVVAGHQRQEAWENDAARARYP